MKREAIRVNATLIFLSEPNFCFKEGKVRGIAKKFPVFSGKDIHLMGGLPGDAHTG